MNINNPINQQVNNSNQVPKKKNCLKQVISNPIRCIGKIVLSLSLILGLGLSYSQISVAALTAKTANTIQGSAPYLATTSHLADIKNGQNFSLMGMDVDGNKYLSDTAFNTVLVGMGSLGSLTPNTILAQLGDGTNGTLSIAYSAPGTGDAIDSDGDTFTPLSLATQAGVPASQIISDWYYKDAGGTETALTSIQKSTRLCDLSSSNILPYLKLQAPVTLTTQYGDPNHNIYNISVASSPIVSSTNGNPQRIFTLNAGAAACYAQPNLEYGDNSGAAPNGLTVSGAILSFAGPTTEWDPKKGFLPQDLSVSGNKNFPTTGFDGAFFNLSLVGTSAQDIIDTMSGTVGSSSYTVNDTNSQTAVILSTTSQPNSLKVTLSGPNETAAKKPTKRFPGVTYKIKSGTKTLYEFTVNDWFIYSSAAPSAWNSLWCNNAHFGGFYRDPKVLEYTNNTLFRASGGAATIGGNFQRGIGQGLQAEWGYVNKNYYTQMSAQQINNASSNRTIVLNENYSTTTRYTADLITGSLSSSQAAIAGTLGYATCIQPQPACSSCNVTCWDPRSSSNMTFSRCTNCATIPGRAAVPASTHLKVCKSPI